MKRTGPTGHLRTLDVSAIMRPWTYHFDYQPVLVVPTDLKFYLHIRGQRGSIEKACSIVVMKAQREYYALRWDAREKTLAGRVCADSFGQIRFTTAEEAQDVLNWHEAWENPVRDQNYHRVAQSVAIKEKQRLGI